MLTPVDSKLWIKPISCEGNTQKGEVLGLPRWTAYSPRPEVGDIVHYIGSCQLLGDNTAIINHVAVIAIEHPTKGESTKSSESRQ